VISIPIEIETSKVETEFFCGEIDGSNLIDYMISYTLNRPRDLLDLCKIAIRQASAKEAEYISSAHIKDALDDYSLNRVIALEDEWKLLYQYLENFIKKIAQYSTHEQVSGGYSPSEFHKVLNDIRDYLSNLEEGKFDSEPVWFLEKFGQSESNPQEIVSTLYDLGIIYLINEGKLSKQASDATMPKITTTSTIKVHPMFSRYMEVMIHEEESPWLPN